MELLFLTSSAGELTKAEGIWSYNELEPARQWVAPEFSTAHYQIVVDFGIHEAGIHVA